MIILDDSHDEEEKKEMEIKIMITTVVAMTTLKD